MRFGVADYGVGVWDGGSFDLEERLLMVRRIGYHGIERLSAVSEADALQKALSYRRLGMDFSTCRGPDVETGIKWTAALGKPYVWVQVDGRDFETFCRQANGQVRIAAKYGIRVGLHNHLGSPVESQAQLEAFLEKCPDCGLILDTGHLEAAGGNSLQILERFHDRLVAVHVKDWFVTNPEIGLGTWYQRGRFCELGAGNIGQDQARFLRALDACGYAGWVFVEHDTHLRDPERDLFTSREYIRRAGF